MIDVKELRIGNYVFPKNGSGAVSVIGEVFAIDDYRVSVKGNHNQYDYHLLEPIPLTKELLLKCGFVYNAVDESFDRLNLRVRILGNSCCAFIGFEVGTGKVWYDANLEIKSLHQLQNINFVLTGKELEIKF